MESSGPAEAASIQASTEVAIQLAACAAPAEGAPPSWNCWNILFCISITASGQFGLVPAIENPYISIVFDKNIKNHRISSRFHNYYWNYRNIVKYNRKQVFSWTLCFGAGRSRAGRSSPQPGRCFWNQPIGYRHGTAGTQWPWTWPYRHLQRRFISFSIFYIGTLMCISS